MSRAGSPARRVLVVEDEPTVARLLVRELESSDCQVRTAVDGASAVQAAIEFRPELVLLDLGLPDLDGLEVLLKLRGWLTCPIIVLTARDSDADKVRALDQGADDYLTKPFSVAELLARVRVAFRHARSAEVPQGCVYRRGACSVDLEARIVRVDDQPVHLTATEYDILRCLIRHAGRVVTHRALLNEIWGPNSVEHTQYLRVYIGQLRKKLYSSTDTSELIATEPGVGYRLAEADL